MAEFVTSLIIQDNDGFPFTLMRDLVYKSDVLDAALVIPAGFNTDYASIPAIVQLLLPKVGRYDRAAVLHDYLYTMQFCDRGTADRVLKEAMKVLHVPGWRIALIYSGVRSGGWVAWAKHKLDKDVPD